MFPLWRSFFALNLRLGKLSLHTGKAYSRNENEGGLLPEANRRHDPRTGNITLLLPDPGRHLLHHSSISYHKITGTCYFNSPIQQEFVKT
ncbi:hypothetical protein A6M21_02585 [Desulfotomaculum copahuensis]|uniref:Uncharacterized protein n=1 Tax=Desulfotomaculum copahuensis TaxID=1838280 RepID=A0A1B7LJR8_9FIRM|nr:hypothetical protein A6M21_02585 [Desulfotomaculum copahuensis]